METKIFSSDEIKDIKVNAIARKHKCSDCYVRQVLLGKRECKTLLAQMIYQDAVDTLAILARKTSVPVL